MFHKLNLRCRENHPFRINQLSVSAEGKLLVACFCPICGYEDHLEFSYVELIVSSSQQDFLVKWMGGGK